MTTQNANPSLDPSNNDSLVGTFRQVLKKELQNIGVCMPAVAFAFDRETARAEVQIQINVLGTNGEQVSRAQIASAPVYQIGGGGFFLSFPLPAAGAPGWLIVCDRDISLYLQSGGPSPPNTLRLHNYADGFFLPDIMGGYTIADEDAENAVLQNLDGTVRVSLGASEIKFTAPTIIFDGPVEIKDRLTVDERIIAQGDISSGANITAVGTIDPNTPIPP